MHASLWRTSGFLWALALAWPQLSFLSSSPYPPNLTLSAPATGLKGPRPALSPDPTGSPSTLAVASAEWPVPQHLADPQQSTRTQPLPQRASPDPTPSQAYSSHKTGHSAQVNPSFPTSFGKVDTEQIRSPDKPPTLSSLPFTCWFDSPLVLPRPPAASCLSARTEPPRCSMEASSPGGPYWTGGLLAPPPPVADSAGRQWGRYARDKPSPRGGSEPGNVGEPPGPFLSLLPFPCGSHPERLGLSLPSQNWIRRHGSGQSIIKCLLSFPLLGCFL